MAHREGVRPDICGEHAIAVKCNHLSGCECFYGDDEMSILETVVVIAEKVEQGREVYEDATGSPPKNFDKFARAVGPIMKAETQKFGIPTFAFWFGDVLRYDPNSLRFTIVASPGSLGVAEGVFLEWVERDGEIKVFRCQTHTDLDSLQDVARTCSFQALRASFFGGVTEGDTTFPDPNPDDDTTVADGEADPDGSSDPPVVVPPVTAGFDPKVAALAVSLIVGFVLVLANR